MSAEQEELRRIVSQACSDAMFAVLPPGEYPLDTAILEKAEAALVDLFKRAAPEPRKLSDITGTKGEMIVGKSKALGFNECLNDYRANIDGLLKREGA